MKQIKFLLHFSLQYFALINVKKMQLKYKNIYKKFRRLFIICNLKFSPTYIMFDIHKELKLKIRDEFLLISFKYKY